MSAHVLLNLLKKFGKTDIHEANEHFISFSQQFKITKPRMLDYIYDMTLRLI